MDGINCRDLDVNCTFPIGLQRVNIRIRLQKGDRLEEVLDGMMIACKIPHYMEPTLKLAIKTLILQQNLKVATPKPLRKHFIGRISRCFRLHKTTYVLIFFVDPSLTDIEAGRQVKLASPVRSERDESDSGISIDRLHILYARLVCGPQRRESFARELAYWETQLARIMNIKFDYYLSILREHHQYHTEELDLLSEKKHFINLTNMLMTYVEQIDHLETSFESDIQQLKHHQREIFREFLMGNELTRPILSEEHEIGPSFDMNKSEIPSDSPDHTHKSMIEELVEMGFTKPSVKIAIAISEGDREKAISMLLDAACGDVSKPLIPENFPSPTSSPSLLQRLYNIGGWKKSGLQSDKSILPPSDQNFLFQHHVRLKFGLVIKRYSLSFELACAKDCLNPGGDSELAWHLDGDRRTFRPISSILLLPVTQTQRNKYLRNSLDLFEDHDMPMNRVVQQFFNYAEKSTELLFDDFYGQFRSQVGLGHDTSWFVTRHSNIPHIQQAWFLLQKQEDRYLIDSSFPSDDFRNILAATQSDAISQISLPIPFDPTFKALDIDDDDIGLHRMRSHLEAALDIIYEHLKGQAHQNVLSTNPRFFPESTLYPSRFRFLLVSYSSGLYQELQRFLISWFDSHP
jgi:hypothetical protein